ncbi:MAG TPA: hypothetical protein VEY30_12745 [Myxococcaceae bacterium]|nr:hypothetical protein [Myxococcaceae bacterium]
MKTMAPKQSQPAPELKPASKPSSTTVTATPAKGDAGGGSTLSTAPVPEPKVKPPSGSDFKPPSVPRLPAEKVAKAK